MQKKNESGQAGGATRGADSAKKDFDRVEKSALGGAHNSGVTSDDPVEKDEIEKQASMMIKQPEAVKSENESETSTPE